jgi:ankyrin repeat protein
MKKCLFLWGVVSVGTVFGMNQIVPLIIEPEQPMMTRFDSRKQLFIALKKDNFPYVEKMLNKKPDLLIDDNNKQCRKISIIFAKKFIAISPFSENYSCIQRLVHGGFDLDIRNKYGISFLSMAIVCWDGRRYIDLLKAGVSVNVCDYQGCTPFDYAVSSGYIRRAQKLLDYGAAVNLNSCVKCMIGESGAVYTWIMQEFHKQKCVDCNTHDYDLSNIPCVNRHLQDGRGWLICTNCYGKRIAEKKGCPLCRHALGTYGA